MLEELFKRPSARARHRNAPLAEERERFLRHLADQGHTRRTLYAFALELHAIVREIDLSDGLRLTLEEVKAAADRWARRQVRRGRSKSPWYSRRLFERTARQWLSFMGRLVLPHTGDMPWKEFIEQYATWMEQECGFSSSTISTRRWHLERFFAWCSAQGRPLSDMNMADIDRYVAIGCKSWSRRTLASLLGRLKSFFRYAERNGWFSSGIAEAIEKPRIYQHENIPLGPSWDEVKRLLESTRTNRPKDIRDRGILLLLALYGLRRGEVARLHLEDFDWENELLRIMRHKQRERATYPLIRSVGDAIIRYLKEVRPQGAGREVFLTLNAPIRPMSAGTVSTMVTQRMIALGIRLPHFGPHALRHACATHLVSEGFSFKEIGDHPGHRSPITTRVYAKVDLAGLRQVAVFDLGGLP